MSKSRKNIYLIIFDIIKRVFPCKLYIPTGWESKKMLVGFFFKSFITYIGFYDIMTITG